MKARSPTRNYGGYFSWLFLQQQRDSLENVSIFIFGLGSVVVVVGVTFQFRVNNPFKPTHFPPKNRPGSDSADETLSHGRLMAVTVCCDPGHRVKCLAVRRAHLGPVQGAAAAAIQLQPARQIIAR